MYDVVGSREGRTLSFFAINFYIPSFVEELHFFDKML